MKGRLLCFHCTELRPQEMSGLFLCLTAWNPTVHLLDDFVLLTRSCAWLCLRTDFSHSCAEYCIQKSTAGDIGAEFISYAL